MLDLSYHSAVILAPLFLSHFNLLPLISDQFSVARVVEALNLGTTAADALAKWSRVVRRREPEFVAREIQNVGDLR